MTSPRKRRHVLVDISVHARLADRSVMAVAGTVSRIGIPNQPRLRILRVCAVRANVLLHVILPRKRLVADRAVDALLPRVLFPVPCGVSGCGERRCAAVARCVRAGILVFSRSSGLGRVSGPA